MIRLLFHQYHLYHNYADLPFNNVENIEFELNDINTANNHNVVTTEPISNENRVDYCGLANVDPDTI